MALVDINNDIVIYPEGYIKQYLNYNHNIDDKYLTDIQKLYKKSNLKMIQEMKRKNLETRTNKKYISCDCGSVVSSTYYRKHIYSKRHQRFIKSIY